MNDNRLEPPLRLPPLLNVGHHDGGISAATNATKALAANTAALASLVAELAVLNERLDSLEQADEPIEGDIDAIGCELNLLLTRLTKLRKAPATLHAVSGGR